MDVKGEGNETNNMVVTWKVRPRAQLTPGIRTRHRGLRLSLAVPRAERDGT